MRFTFTVEIEVERTEGKFAGRDELSEQLLEAISEAQSCSLEGENGGTYEIIDFSVEEEEQPKPVRRSRPKAKPEPEPEPSMTSLAELLP